MAKKDYDPSRYKVEEIIENISLSHEEFDTVVNTLISKGYGNIDRLQEEIKRRQKVFGGFNLSNEQEEDEMFTVTFIED